MEAPKCHKQFMELKTSILKVGIQSFSRDLYFQCQICGKVKEKEYKYGE